MLHNKVVIGKNLVVERTSDDEITMSFMDSDQKMKVIKMSYKDALELSTLCINWVSQSWLE